MVYLTLKLAAWVQRCRPPVSLAKIPPGGLSPEGILWIMDRRSRLAWASARTGKSPVRAALDPAASATGRITPGLTGALVSRATLAVWIENELS
jgi:hypothetical protein